MGVSDSKPRMTFGGPVGDDGATTGSFDRTCEQCEQRHPGLMWMWEPKKWLCPICAVGHAYGDAIQALVDFINLTPLDPFARRDLTDLAQKLADKQRRNLGG